MNFVIFKKTETAQHESYRKTLFSFVKLSLHQQRKVSRFYEKLDMFILKKIDKKTHSMQRKMKFALFGNTYQEHKSARNPSAGNPPAQGGAHLYPS